ncbi:MAG TPA: hypothetical protein VJ719_05395 [Chthoniobacterales bacterium]|nr:hypothetical protein [Chthoniobacterales bacterium]
MSLKPDSLIGIHPDRQTAPYGRGGTVNSCASPPVRTPSSAMLEYELYVPLHYNDGRPIDPEKLKALKRRLVDQFGGLTHFRQENEGLWKIGDHTFRDRVEILRVLVSDEAAARKYFTQLKADLTREWEQQDFLIVTRQVSAL